MCIYIYIQTHVDTHNIYIYMTICIHNTNVIMGEWTCRSAYMPVFEPGQQGKRATHTHTCLRVAFCGIAVCYDTCTHIHTITCRVRAFVLACRDAGFFSMHSQLCAASDEA